MDNFIRYTYYDETDKKVAIIDLKTPKEVIIELQKNYDEVKYEE